MYQNISKARLNFSLEAHEIKLLIEEFLLPEITGKYFEFSVPLYAESLSGKVRHIKQIESKLTDQYIHLSFNDILLQLGKTKSATPLLELGARIIISIDSTQLLSGKINKLSIDLKTLNENPKSISSFFFSGGLKLIIPFLKTFLQKKIESRIKLFPEAIAKQVNEMEAQIQQQFAKKTKQEQLKLHHIETTIFPIKGGEIPFLIEMSFAKTERLESEPFFNLRESGTKASAEGSQIRLYPEHIPFLIPQIQTQFLGKTQYIDTKAAELKSDGLYLQFEVSGWTDASIISHWVIDNTHLSSPALIRTSIQNIKNNPAGWMLRLLKGKTEKKISHQIQAAIGKLIQSEIPGFSVPVVVDRNIYVSVDLQLTDSFKIEGDQLRLNLNLGVSIERQTTVTLLTSTTEEKRVIGSEKISHTLQHP